MKDVKKLQIGNWVNVQGKDVPMQITAIANDGSIEVDNEYYCIVEELYSIWLNGIILSKNFEKIRDEWRVADSLRIGINHSSGKNWALYKTTEEVGYPLQFVPVCTFNFVHELQNALHVYDIEKEVIL